MSLRLLNLPALPIPLVALLLTPVLPTASAADDAEAVDTAGFWLGFSLILVVSAVEAAASIIWIRRRVTSDGIHPCEVSDHICGRQISVEIIDLQTAKEKMQEGMFAGFFWGPTSSASYNGIVMNSSARLYGCNPCCGGGSTMRAEVHGDMVDAVEDKFGSLVQVPTLLIRRFNPITSLEAPAGLVNNIKNIVWLSKGRTVGQLVEHTVHLFFGLLDVSLGVAGLVLTPGSPQNLYETLKDPEAPMSFENYLTLFLLYWLLGVLLLICMIPLRSERRSIQIFGWPGAMAKAIAALASLVLFCLGCWKIDYARHHDAPWTPMLSYWIGGASVITIPFFDMEVFHIFGLVGLVFMLKHVFS
jgi:hypothetical protein